MSEKPIIFSTAMVNAILERRKTQSRRVVKPQLTIVQNEMYFDAYNGGPQWNFWTSDNRVANNLPIWKCPYGMIGDHLWVRETFRNTPVGVLYAATCNDDSDSWTPSIFMPHSTSRITLKITNIRVERVQDISEEDAVAEGCFDYKIKQTPQGYIGYSEKYKAWRLPQVEFQDLWDSINAKRGYGWNVNPWVWVIEFKKV